MSKTVCAFITVPVGDDSPVQEVLSDTFRENIARHLKMLVSDCHIAHFICGMERGVDLLIAESIVELRHAFPHVTWEAALSDELQAAEWPEDDRDRFFDLVEQCDKETLVSRKKTLDSRQKRDCYMRNSADMLVQVDAWGNASMI